MKGVPELPRILERHLAIAPGVPDEIATIEYLTQYMGKYHMEQDDRNTPERAKSDGCFRGHDHRCGTNISRSGLRKNVVSLRFCKWQMANDDLDSLAPAFFGDDLHSCIG
jgi:hypothetical protein